MVFAKELGHKWDRRIGVLGNEFGHWMTPADVEASDDQTLNVLMKSLLDFGVIFKILSWEA